MYGSDPVNIEIKSTIKLLEIINISKYCMEYKDKRYAFEINLFHRIKSLSKHKVRGFDRLLILVARNILKNKVGKTCVKTNYGFPMIVNPKRDLGLENKIYFTGEYETGTLRFLQSVLKNKGVFLDIGANIGLYSLYVSYYFPEIKVLSFEPLNSAHAILTENIKLNEFKNIEIFNYALGSKRENLYINEHEYERGSSFITTEPTNEEISLFSLDEIYEDITSEKISAIKIDVEGFELEVLKGGENIIFKKHRPIIIIECSDLRNYYKATKDDIFEYVSNYEYILYKSDSGKDYFGNLIEIFQKKDLPTHDNIFCFPKESTNVVK